MLSKTEAAGTSSAATTSYAYDPATLGITQLTDPDNHTSAATYDANGNQVSFTDPLNRQTTATYNSLNEPLTVTDPSGVTTSRTYDANGNLLSVSRPLNGTQTQTVTYHYDDANHPGDVTSTTDPNGHTTSFSYESQGDLASITDAMGDETTFSSDVLGERTSMVSPRGKVSGGNPSQYTTSYQYDPLRRLTQTTDPLGHTSTRAYDGDGNLTSTTDGDKKKTSYTYDLDNELTKVTRADATTPTYGYDGDGNQTSQTDGANHITSYSYDALDRVASVTDPLNRTTSYGYDAAGNLTSLTDPSGRTTSYGYDAANELTAISYSDGTTPNVSFTYTANGLRATMSDGSGTASYSYDQLNRLTSQTNGANQTVAYGYDLAGNLASLTYPNTKTVTRSYDNANRLTGITDWLGHTTSFTPDPDSNTTSIAYPNGITATNVFDQADQLSSITDKNSGGSTLASFGYSRDNNGQLTGETPTGSGQGSNQSYAYDSLNQLTGVNSSNYSYDAADNLTGLISGASQSYNAANQLTSSTLNGTTSSYSYSPEGNRTSAGPLLTVSGNEITDAVRNANIQGDGRTPPDSSFGIWANTTNLETNGGFESGISGWGSKDHYPATVSWDQTRSDAKFGSGSLEVVTPGSNNSEGAESNGTTVSASTTYTASIWVNATPGATLTFCVEENPANTCHNLNFTASGGWQRYAQTVTTSSTTTGLTLEVSTNGVQATTFWLDGAQIEQQPIATPYVEPNGTSASRGSPFVKLPVVNAPFTETQGWVAFRLRTGWSNSNAPSNYPALMSWLSSDANGTHSIQLYFSKSGQGFVLVRRDDPNSGIVGAGTVTFTAGDQVTVVAAWTATQLKISVNGGAFHTANNSTIPTITATMIKLGTNDQYGNQPLDGDIFWAAAGSGTLTDTDAATLNNLGNTDPSLGQLPGSPGFAWTADTAAYQTASSGSASYRYDQANRLTTATVNGTTSSYSYDGDGLRASETSGGSTQHFAWDHSGNLPLPLTDGSTTYIYDDQGLPFEQIDSNGTPLYYQHDQLGSTRLLTDQSGTVVATYTFDPYGNETSHTGTADTPLRWAGQYQDVTTGFYYLRARYYDPQTGEFLERDRFAPVTQEPYAYVDDDPLNNADPLGLAPDCQNESDINLLGVQSCQGARQEGNFGYIATQVSPKGRLQIGAYPWQGPVSGIWSYQVWVNGRAWHRWWIFPVPKVQTYPPHWSIKRKNAPPGSLIHINVNYMGPAGIAYGNLYCVMPLLTVPPGTV
ncbi:MAG TPA: RHS repeat-associated core domain-containing protein [Gaiellaceae bacterium]|nr:RHS repeat-associated core domain-containing protein [Gaiellaceae bacterium]